MLNNRSNINSGSTQQNIPVTLEISSNIHAENRSFPITQTTTSVGRHPSNDIVLNEPVISAFHFQIVSDGSQFTLIHPHPSKTMTTNGIYYQGHHIKGNEKLSQTITSGTTFRIGDQNGTLVTFVFTDTRNVYKAPPTTQPILLNDLSISIGRFMDNKVILNHPQISGHHAKIVFVNQGHQIIDLGSTNHTYVNGEQIRNYYLKKNDAIDIGPFKFIYTGAYLTQYNDNTSIRIDALHLKRYGNKKTLLLNDISLTIPSRKFVAIVGGSGTGKSTLINALSGLHRADEGTVLYNGKDYYRWIGAFKKQLGYVPQEDIVHRDLTVERALYYAARLRLPQDFTPIQINQRIDEVLNDVEMQPQRKMIIAKLSGGQRKRISIALELLAKPSIFFLDEPTSGLDPGLDRKMMLLLRQLADRGHTIVLVTHATNNINACDYICFLTGGGRLAYFGPPNDAKKFFSKADFAEIYGTLDSSSPSIAESLFLASQDYQKYLAYFKSQQSTTQTTQQIPQSTKMKNGNTLQQFLLLSIRYLELLKNDSGNLFLLILQAPIVAAILLLLIQFGVGTGGFDPKNVIQCPTTAKVFTTAGLPDFPTPSNPAVTTDCNQLKMILTTTAQGRTYAVERGGVQKALQDFIVPGPGDPADLLLVLTFAAIMFGCLNSAREIVKEISIYTRERAVNVGIIPYMFSKIVVLGFISFLQCTILTAAVNSIDPFLHGTFLSGFIEVDITLTLAAFAGLMMGLTLSATVQNNDRAMSCIPIILIPQVIFSGLLFPLKELPLQIIGVLIPARWAISALGSSVGLHSDKLLGDKLFGNINTFHGTLFSIYSQTDAIIYLIAMWFAQFGLILVFIFLTLYFLKRKDVQ